MDSCLCRRAFVAGLFAVPLPGIADNQDPWPQQAILQPEVLADVVSKTNRPKPTILYVGFPALYTGAHISGAILAGPTSKPTGVDLLRQAVKNIPHEREVVIYCGCCPFAKCPNIRPAYTWLHENGFSNVKVLVIETNLHTDWVSKGYPVTKGPMPVAAADVKNNQSGR